MENVGNNMEGKSYSWVPISLLLAILLFAFLTSIGLKFSFYISGILVVIFGFSPFLITVTTGFAFGKDWKLRWSRKTEPWKYWILLFLSLVVGFWFLFVTWVVISKFS